MSGFRPTQGDRYALPPAARQLVSAMLSRTRSADRGAALPRPAAGLAGRRPHAQADVTLSMDVSQGNRSASWTHEQRSGPGPDWAGDGSALARTVAARSGPMWEWWTARSAGPMRRSALLRDRTTRGANRGGAVAFGPSAVETLGQRRGLDDCRNAPSPPISGHQARAAQRGGAEIERGAGVPSRRYEHTTSVPPDRSRHSPPPAEAGFRREFISPRRGAQRRPADAEARGLGVTRSGCVGPADVTES